MALLRDFAERHPDQVVSLGDTWYLGEEAAAALVEAAAAKGVPVVGLKGCMVYASSSFVQYAPDRDIEFPRSPSGEGAREARRLLAGPWIWPSIFQRPMDPSHKGRYMFVVSLDES